MSENKTESAEQSKSSAGLIVILFIILLAALGLGLYANKMKPTAPTDGEQNAVETASVEDTHATDHAETASTEEEHVHGDESTHDESHAAETVNTDTQETTNTAAPLTAELDLKALGTPRILGNPEAPLKISERSSFTCGGCGAFHKGNFKEIKRDYIDTGKAYIVYDDFPRNKPDLLIGAVARCVPENSFFQFVQLIFETQQDWLTKDASTFIPYMVQNAKLTGISEDRINACVDSEDLHKTLAEHRETAAKKFGVGSTPTLVLNDKTVISGLMSYKDLKAALDKAIAESK